MKKRATSNKPICYACNRPFDPTSPGATLTMGPTCAKKAALNGSTGPNSAGLRGQATQLSFCPEADSISGSFKDLFLTSEDFKNLSPRLKAYRRAKPKSLVSAPKHLLEKYTLAQIAFDELLREFGSKQSLHYAEKALALRERLEKSDIEVHSLHDPSLGWLAPEYDRHLILDRSTSLAFYQRMINETCSLLEIDPRGSPGARKNIDVIVSFSKACRDLRNAEAAHQLSLGAMEFI